MQLNKWQQQVIDARAKGPQVVEACPGSGKTRLIESLIASLLENGIPADRIGAFTFSNKAAGEMRWRIARTLWPEITAQELAYFADPFNQDAAAAAGITRDWVEADPKRQFIVDWVCTIHALSFRLLKSAGYKFNVLSGRTSFEATSVIKDYIAESKWQESPKSVKAWISKAILALVEPGQSKNWFAERLEIVDGPVWAARNLAEVYKRYVDFTKRANVVDFDQMQSKVIYLLRNDPGFRAKAGAMFDYIVVDEAQDTSPEQSEIRWALAERVGNILYCGDCDQSLFRFRGAEPLVLREHFEARWSGAQRFNLPVNYRSTRHIIDAATRLISANYVAEDQKRYLKPFDSREDAPTGEPITYTELQDFSALTDEITSVIRQSETPGNWFVLSRTRAECAAIHMALTSSGIKTINKSGGMVFGTPHVRKVLAYARLACNYRNARDDVDILKEIANVASNSFRAPMTRRRHLPTCREERPWINCGCPIVMEQDNDYSHSRFYGEKAIDDAGNWAGIIRQSYESNRGKYPTVRAKGAQDLLQFVNRIALLQGDAHAAISSIVSNCVAPWLMAEEGITDDDLAENGKAEDFDLLLGLTEPGMTLEKYLTKLDELAMGGEKGSSAAESESVLIGTFHWSKGAERSCVIVNTTRLPIIPPAPKPDQLPMGLPPTIAEERRLAFVGISRGKDRVMLMGSRNWNNREVETSQFVRELGL